MIIIDVDNLDFVDNKNDLQTVLNIIDPEVKSLKL
jgi:deoxyadenosine/deoxycytidine kinase